MGPPVGGCMTSCRDHGTEKSGYYPRPGIEESQSMDLQEQPLVSVVTPVYNGEKYLIECIESVLAQTYRNWEYIIVNNCSTDRSFDIAQSYAQRDARIRIHNNREFVAVIQNHNIAFRQISPQSRFCKIVHADDWLFPECIRPMVDFGFVHQVLTYIRRHDESMTSSFAHRLNTIILSNLDLLVRYGPIYLSDNEYRRRLKHEMSEYYRFLANNI